MVAQRAFERSRCHAVGAREVVTVLHADRRDAADVFRSVAAPADEAQRGDEGSEPPVGAVEPHEPILIVFSEAMDPASLNETTIRIVRDSTPISASVSYDDATSSVTLRPSAPLVLAGLHVVTVSSEVMDSGGTALEAQFQWSFRVRDGQWGTAQRISITGDVSRGPYVAASERGGAVAAWHQGGSPGETWASRFVPSAGWATAQKISTAPSHGMQGVGIDNAGNAIAVWYLE